MAALARVDCVVIGAGAIGLACGRALSGDGFETLILEAAGKFGTGTSSRNSEVIHAGIYYPTDSLKARLCVEGKDMLYDYVKDRRIPYQQCGKLIVAGSATEIPRLHNLQKQALRNGVKDLQLLTADEVSSMEPEVRCSQGLLSPSTGILCSHTFMHQLLADAESHGADCVLHCAVERGTIQDDGSILLETSQGPIHAGLVINAAGLHAIGIAQRLATFDRRFIPRAYFAKGNYFHLDGEKVASSRRFSRLVYPMPEVGGLGIHATIDLSGSVRFGPDVEWLRANGAASTTNSSSSSSSVGDSGSCSASSGVDEYRHYDSSVPTDYTVDPCRAEIFYGAIRKYWPSMPDDSLLPDYSGIRPKLCLPAALSHPTPHDQAQQQGHEQAVHYRDLTDFAIEGPETHNVRGLVNLFGIESPGLTASLSIAQYVLRLVKDAGH